MATVYDKLLRLAAKTSPTLTAPGLKECKVIKADNVVDYLYSTDQLSPRLILDLPCVTPPFENVFVEFTIDGIGMGWHIHRGSPDLGQIKIKALEAHGMKWILGGYYYSPEYPNEPMLRAAVALDGSGAIIPVANGDPYRISPLTKTAQRVWGIPEFKQSGVDALNVVLWTLAFMHTKGAVIDDVTPPPAVSKRHQKRYKAPLCSYKTVKVCGFGRAPQEAQGGQHDTPRLHIVRGHWADYRNGAGMFGNPDLRAVFWISEHERGRGEKGAIKTTYEVYPHE